MSDEEWPANIAIVALQKLQQLHANEAIENEEDAAHKEGSHHQNVYESVQSALDHTVDTKTQVTKTQDTQNEN